MDEQKVDFVYEAERLIELFKELEEVIREKAKHVGVFVDRASLDYLIKELSSKSRVVAKYKDEIITIKEIRNINTHHRGIDFVDSAFLLIQFILPAQNLQAETLVIQKTQKTSSFYLFYTNFAPTL